MKYIPNLHIHQHSLLTRKVFFRHNFQHKYSSLYILDHHRVLVIFRSSSSSIHLHLQVIFIIGSGSSLDIITGSGSSLDLDHHYWIIITRSRSSLGHHHRCYLWILLVIGTFTEPVLFHTGCIITKLVLFHTR